MSEADYICVLDTGSTDGTYEHFKKIAEHDNKLYLKQKIFDDWRFDVARNDSMKLIPDDANILVCTDLDEVFEPGWAEELREKWVPGETERAWYKYTWSHDENGNELRTFYYDKIHSPHWHWEYPVHETLVNNETGDNTSSHCATVTLSDKVHLHHYPDQSKSRASYLPLLELRKQENPDEWYGRIYLAQEYSYRGLYEKSNAEFEEIKAKFFNLNDVTTVERASCYLFSAENYIALDEIDKAKEMYRIGIDVDPSLRECYLGLAELLIAEEDYKNAIILIQESIRNTYRHYNWLERDRSWTTQPWDMLCYAYYNYGMTLESVMCAAKALQFCPEDKRLQSNIVACVEKYSDKELMGVLSGV